MIKIYNLFYGKSKKHMKSIYIISANINGEILYKIGISKDAKKRLKELKTGNAADLNIINQFESKWASKIEANLHRRFYSTKISGEWFSLTPEIVSNFTNMCEKLHETFEYLSLNNTWIIDNSILRR